MANIQDIMGHLYRGETLRIDDQEAAYIHLQDNEDKPLCFIMRRILDKEERQAKERGEKPKYTESQHQSLAEALLTLMDYSWQQKDKSS